MFVNSLIRPVAIFFILCVWNFGQAPWNQQLKGRFHGQFWRLLEFNWFLLSFLGAIQSITWWKTEDRIENCSCYKFWRLLSRPRCVKTHMDPFFCPQSRRCQTPFLTLFRTWLRTFCMFGRLICTIKDGETDAAVETIYAITDVSAFLHIAHGTTDAKSARGNDPLKWCSYDTFMSSFTSPRHFFYFFIF
jgi:hypothetical protein